MTDDECCDRPRMWAGTGWVPHTDEYHAHYRAQLLGLLHQRLLQRTAVQAGHKVTIRFTQDHAWYECSCGSKGRTARYSSHARQDALTHLTEAGIVFMDGGYRFGSTDPYRPCAAPSPLLCHAWYDALENSMSCLCPWTPDTPTVYPLETEEPVRRETGREKIRRLEGQVRRARRKAARANARADYAEQQMAVLRLRAIAAERRAVIVERYPGRVTNTNGDHVYLSTGCLHGRHTYCQSEQGVAGAKRPAECKHCAAPCQCPCHWPPADAGCRCVTAVHPGHYPSCPNRR